MADRNNGEVTFDIIEHIAVIKSNENGWNKEVNIVAWNGGQPKVDIREGNAEHDRMTRGITLTEPEAEKMAKAIGMRMVEKQKADKQKDDFAR